MTTEPKPQDLSIQERLYPDLPCFGCGHGNPDGLKLRSYPGPDYADAGKALRLRIWHSHFMRMQIHVRPQTAGTRVGGRQENALIVRVRAVPGDPRGTEIALRAVATAFGVRRTDVSLVGGALTELALVNVAGGVESDLVRRRDQLLAL